MYEDLRAPYKTTSLPAIHLGGILIDKAVISDAPVNLVVKSLNRHGLIAGATGSGKTKTIQVISEQLSLLGIPSLVMDIKGDLSGLAKPAEINQAILERSQVLAIDYKPLAFPVELLTLNESSSEGVPLRSTVGEFGSVLFARMLDVNDTQAGVLTILFEYAKEKQLSLNELDDLKALLQFAQTEAGKQAIEEQYGHVATASVGAIVRKVIELEAQGTNQFFGEPAFAVKDLIRTTAQGVGIISVLRLLDMQDKPKLFSTFMLKLLSDVYKNMPELGDSLKPRLVLFIDEAHLVFNHASKALLDLLDTMVKLIRSKGIGLIFCTQSPTDIPESVLSQLGLKIQHSLRAFTAKDRKAMKLIAQNFPASTYYNTEQLLTSLGIGEALVSALNAEGQPMPLVKCLIRAPQSRMGILTPQEIAAVIAESSLMAQYGQRKKTESLRVCLPKTGEAKGNKINQNSKKESILGQLTKNTLFRQVFRQIIRDLTRALFSLLGIKRR